MGEDIFNAHSQYAHNSTERFLQTGVTVVFFLLADGFVSLVVSSAAKT